MQRPMIQCPYYLHSSNFINDISDVNFCRCGERLEISYGLVSHTPHCPLCGHELKELRKTCPKRRGIFAFFLIFDHEIHTDPFEGNFINKQIDHDSK